MSSKKGSQHNQTRFYLVVKGRRSAEFLPTLCALALSKETFSGGGQEGGVNFSLGLGEIPGFPP